MSKKTFVYDIQIGIINKQLITVNKIFMIFHFICEPGMQNEKTKNLSKIALA